MDAARHSAMGELAGALAHELNQPLAAVTNYVNACRQELRNYGADISGSVGGLMERAVQETSRAADLVRRLRNFISSMRGFERREWCATTPGDQRCECRQATCFE